MATFTVVVGTTAIEIIPANTLRASFYLRNNDATEVLYLGEDATITVAAGAAAGFPLPAAGIINEDMGERLFKGAVFGIVAAGTAEVRVWERTNPR